MSGAEFAVKKNFFMNAGFSFFLPPKSRLEKLGPSGDPKNSDPRESWKLRPVKLRPEKLRPSGCLDNSEK